MNLFFNIIIVICLITTFLVLLLGLLHTARSGDEKNNNVNKFMRYRVFIQFASILILTLALLFYWSLSLIPQIGKTLALLSGVCRLLWILPIFLCLTPVVVQKKASPSIIEKKIAVFIDNSLSMKEKRLGSTSSLNKALSVVNIIKEKWGGSISKIGKTRIKTGKDILANIEPNDT